ncbi:hypothetical protein ACLKA7_015369 [Drosophila subpalustris]
MWPMILWMIKALIYLLWILPRDLVQSLCYPIVVAGSSHGHMFVVITCELTRRFPGSFARPPFYGAFEPRDLVTCPQFGYK